MNGLIILVRGLIVLIAFGVSSMGFVWLTVEYKFAEVAAQLMGSIICGIAIAYFVGWVLFTEPEWPEEDEREGAINIFHKHAAERRIFSAINTLCF